MNVAALQTVRTRSLICDELQARAAAEGRLGLVISPVKGERAQWADAWSYDPERDMWETGIAADFGRFGHGTWVRAPHRPGDVLWVREALRRTDERPHGVAFAADGAPLRIVSKGGGMETEAAWMWEGAVLSSAQMPRWAARTHLRVLSVECRRVQSVTEEEARMAGFTGHDPEPADEGGTIYAWHGRSSAPCPRAHFATWWSRRYRKLPWESDPWCWWRFVEKTEVPDHG